jgi:hypothetical protein
MTTTNIEHRSRYLPAVLFLAGAFMILAGVPGNGAFAEKVCAFSPGKAGFSVKFNDEVCPYRVMGIFVLPGELLSLEAEGADEDREFSLEAAGGRVTRTQSNRWFWRAPRESGLYPIVICPCSAPEASRAVPDETITLNVFVMVPFGEIENECLGEFRIGRYPTRSRRGSSNYELPDGFIEVTEENQETLVSPHFRIRQFLCKQKCGCPKYLVLRERLLLKLERLLEEFNRRGHCCPTLHIMSGYRTPYYNRLIGNVAYSRHLWGDAVDFFIDHDPRDGMMDDLNGDGRIDYNDATLLYDIIEEISERPWYEKFLGGLGWYRRTSSHGPFVHVDVRGYRARW